MTRQFQNLTLVLLVWGLFLLPNQSKACVDYHNSIWVSCDYDSSFSEVLIRVNNMQLFGGPQGAFCTCALSSHTDLFSNIQYVSFVDSGTTNATAGFLPWTPSSNAGTAWDNAQAGNWDGFLAEATASLTTGHPVDLIIRATLPPGYTVFLLDSSLQSVSLGTDEYDILGDSLALSHNDVSNSISYPYDRTQRSITFFNSLDNTFTGLLALAPAAQTIHAYPNPFSNEVTFELDIEDPTTSQIVIVDLTGRVVHNVLPKTMHVGENQFRWKPDNLPNGVYVLQHRSNKALRVQYLTLNRE